MFEYRALGPLTIAHDGEPVRMGGARQRRLVAMLLLYRNSVVSADRLTEVVFAGEPTPAAHITLRSYVSRLRKVIDSDSGASTVVTRAPGYMLALPEDAFDVTRFERLLADGQSRLEKNDAAAAASVLREALTLWRGEPYAEFADEDWARPETQRLAELRLFAHEQLVDAELACGRPSDVIAALETLVAEQPLRDGFRERLMLALYRSGRHVEALRMFQEYRSVLGEELGLAPSPELVALERRILEHDPTLQLAEPAGHPLRGYRLGERLGTGGDGTVYAAHLPTVARDLAIRVYRDEVADHPEFVRSFEADAQRVAGLRHAAIVPISDYWREPGAAYLVMRRMRGGTLRDRLERGRLKATDVASLVGRIGGALAAATAHGVVHGRVAPESIFFDERGVPYLSDFVLGGSAADAASDVRRFASVIAGCLADDMPPRPSSAALSRELSAELSAGLAADPDRGPYIEQFTARLMSLLAGDSRERERLANPYKGLRAFDECDADYFFGRDALVDEMLARLAREDLPGRLILVVGASGSGKSSVVRAGLLPRLRRGEVPGGREWFVTTMVPGAAPFKELAEALRRVAVSETDGLADELARDDGGIDRVLRRLVPGNGQLVLVVDQLEELFTLASEREQKPFLDALMHAVTTTDSRLRVVATLRADFYDRPLQFQAMGAAVRDTTVTVPAMSAAELEAAVVGPAERVEGKVDGALAAELVAAVRDQPAALPSLQFTLYELAERSSDGILTLAGYTQLGGLDGAIASRAEQLYTALDDAEREALRRMFEYLVVLSGDGEPIRRRAPRSELMTLVADQAVDDVVEAWVQARLLTVDRHPGTREPTVEVAHEALLREWPRLRGWVEESRGAIVALGHIREAAASWAELGRDRGALYRGARLEHVLDVVTSRQDTLPALEREFLDESRRERDEERRREADNVARQARANRRLRVQVAVIAVALVIAILVGFLAVDQRERARRQGRIAVARELAAAAIANLDVDPERSVLLALEAVERSRTDDGAALPEAEEALHRAVVASRLVMTVPGIGGALDWSPDGTVFVTEGPDESGLVDIRDARTGASVRSFPGHRPDVNDVAFSADGSMLATTGDDGLARIWDPATGEEIWSFTAPGSAWAPSFSPDGSLFAAGWWGEGIVRVWDLTTGRMVHEIGPFDLSFGTSFSPDGSRLAISTFDSGAVVVDVATGAELFTTSSVGQAATGATDDLALARVWGAEWSPDGRWIATSGVDATLRISDAATGNPRFTLFGHTSEVMVADWSPDSTRLVTGSSDGTAKVWEITEDGGREVLSLAARERGGGVWVAFSPDGDRVMTGNQDITAVTIWDVSRSGDAEWANLPADIAPFSSVAFTVDGRRVIASNGDGSMTVWDAETGRRSRRVGGHGAPTDPGIYVIDVSPDGKLIATSGPDEVATVWDLNAGRALFTVRPGPAQALAWSPDGAVLAVADGKGAVRIVSRSGRRVALLRERGGFTMSAVAFSPDGRLLATAAAPPGRPNPARERVTFWDWDRGELVKTINTSANVIAFHPNGDRIAVGKHSGPAEVWGVESGEKVATLAGHAGPVFDIAYRPDGALIATASADGTVGVWDATFGRQRLVLRGHRSVVWDLAFSPDGSKLVSAGADSTPRVWALQLDDLIDIARRELTRSLTDAECRRYLHLDRCT